MPKPSSTCIVTYSSSTGVIERRLDEPRVLVQVRVRDARAAAAALKESPESDSSYDPLVCSFISAGMLGGHRVRMGLLGALGKQVRKGDAWSGRFAGVMVSLLHAADLAGDKRGSVKGRSWWTEGVKRFGEPKEAVTFFDFGSGDLFRLSGSGLLEAAGEGWPEFGSHPGLGGPDGMRGPFGRGLSGLDMGDRPNAMFGTDARPGGALGASCGGFGLGDSGEPNIRDMLRPDDLVSGKHSDTVATWKDLGKTVGGGIGAVLGWRTGFAGGLLTGNPAAAVAGGLAGMGVGYSVGSGMGESGAGAIAGFVVPDDPPEKEGSAQPDHEAKAEGHGQHDRESKTEWHDETDSDGRVTHVVTKSADDGSSTVDAKKGERVENKTDNSVTVVHKKEDGSDDTTKVPPHGVNVDYPNPMDDTGGGGGAVGRDDPLMRQLFRPADSEGLLVDGDDRPVAPAGPIYWLKEDAEDPTVASVVFGSIKSYLDPLVRVVNVDQGISRGSFATVAGDPFDSGPDVPHP